MFIPFTHLTVLSCILPLLNLAYASETVLLEQANNQDPGRRLWKRTQRLPADASLTVRIGLVQQDHQAAYDRLMNISHPLSPQYGQHLSKAEVTELFAPDNDTLDSVRQWLQGRGVDDADVIPYSTGGWLGVVMNVSHAEDLLQTEYYEYEHQGATRVGCSSYYVPKSLAQHIDYITPGVKLSAPIRKRMSSRFSHARTKTQARDDSNNTNGNLADASSSLGSCINAWTSVCWRTIYQIPTSPRKLLHYAFGVYEFGDSYAQSDLDMYYKQFAPSVPGGTGPDIKLIDGATAPINASSDRNTGEATVDLDVSIPLLYPQPVVLYQVDDIEVTNAAYAKNWSGVYNTFLDALDGSYCNLTAYGITGDTPSIDGQYPDPAPGGYKGPLMCGTYTPTTVISISNAQAEGDFPERYQKRQCLEFMKLALQGHTILFPSGDTGVASYPGDGSDTGCLSGSGQDQSIFAPYMPSGCPFVTSVGGTQLQENETNKYDEVALNNTVDGVSSGGGFSNIFEAPAYQKSALQEYFSKHDPGYPSYNTSHEAIGAHGGRYNRAGRGYPDVSGVASNFITVIGGQTVTGSGTSLSVPLWGAIITMINAERNAANKSSVGFINPTLYAHAESALRDVQSGSNPGCGTAGFSAVDGWDPVTGLGTPIYPKLLELFLSLP